MTRPGEEVAAVTDWLIAFLKTLNFRVGDHGIPPGEGFPFLVVRSIPVGQWSGPLLAGTSVDAALTFQVDAVGETRQQAQRLQGRAHHLLTARNPETPGHLVMPPNPAGINVHDRMPEGTPPGVEVAGDPPREVYTVSERYVLSITPG